MLFYLVVIVRICKQNRCESYQKVYTSIKNKAKSLNSVINGKLWQKMVHRIACELLLVQYHCILSTKNNKM